VADGYGHQHADPYANTDSHLDPIAHAHAMVDGNTHAYRHQRADSNAAVYLHTHSSAVNQYTNVDPVTIGNSHAGAADQYPDAYLITDADADTSAADFHADTYFYAYASTDSYQNADSYVHTIANIQAVGYGNQAAQKAALADGYDAGRRVAHVYAQSFTDSYAVCHEDQHAKAIADFNSNANGDS
jgi:hypothetical protein